MSIVGIFSEEIVIFAETQPHDDSMMATTSNLSTVNETQAAGSTSQATTSYLRSLLSQLRAPTQFEG